ncbi:MAG TPA: hypothetical protein VLU38_05280, partial [Methanomassiliicoccales archaeon]|nr:hypothetical protein [Methanomassiliicoccales archaeon]
MATIENRQLKIRNNINPKPTIAFHVILELSILIVGLFLYLIDGPSSSGIPWLGLWITLVMALVALRIIHIKILRT